MLQFRTMTTIPPIFHAIDQNNLDAVVQSLAAGVPVNLPHPHTRKTPLMLAVSSPSTSLSMVQTLIQNGADVNAALMSEPLPALEESINFLMDNSTLPSELLDQIRSLTEFTGSPSAQNQEPQIQANVLSLAASAGNPAVVQALLDAGADIHRILPSNYNVLIQAVTGRHIVGDRDLIPLLQLLVSRGADLNIISDYSESALSRLSHVGRFDAIQFLLNAGADPAPLQWTSLMHAIALGSLQDVHAQLAAAPDLAARDFWERTPWLLSLCTNDVAKSQALLKAGANRADRGRCGSTPLMYPIMTGHFPMLQWLLSEGFSPDDHNEFNQTPLCTAVEYNNAPAVDLLLKSGVTIHSGNRPDDPLIKNATSLAVVRLLLQHGADIRDLSDDMRAALVHLPKSQPITATIEEYRAARTRRFGTANPEKMNLPFWVSMVYNAGNAYAARMHFDDENRHGDPVWCCQRFGRSITELPDGRIIEIGGEHEDSYDPDFCIYNDVIVHHPNGAFDIYGYPSETFPPTDFHSATLVNDHIIIIGRLGYTGQRNFNHTPVYRLNTTTLKIESLPTTGQIPGWISRHTATLTSPSHIQITAGKISLLQNDAEQLIDNPCTFELNLQTLKWSRTT